MPKSRKKKAHVSNTVDFEMHLPQSILDSFDSLTQDNYLPLAATFHGKCSTRNGCEEVQVGGVKQNNVLKLLFKDVNREMLSNLMKDAWRCELSSHHDQGTSESSTQALPVRLYKTELRNRGNRKRPLKVATADPKPPEVKQRRVTRKSALLDMDNILVKIKEEINDNQQELGHEIGDDKNRSMLNYDDDSESCDNEIDMESTSLYYCHDEDTLPNKIDEDDIKYPTNDTDFCSNSSQICDVNSSVPKKTPRRCPKKFQCSVCLHLFKRRTLLKEHTCQAGEHDHTETVSPNKQRAELYKRNDALCHLLGYIDNNTSPIATACVICQRLLSRKSDLLTHLEDSHRIKLDAYLSLLDISSKDEREEAIKRSLEAEEAEGDCAVDNANRSCPSCSGYYSSWTNLLSHIHRMHKEDTDYPDLLTKFEEQRSKSYKCVQKDDKKRQLTCHYCNVTRYGKTLIKHLNTAHSQETDFQMVLEEAMAQYNEQCNNKRRARQKELYLRDKETPFNYTCKFCEREFNVKSALRRHLRLFCRSNPDRCTTRVACTCGKWFSSKEEKYAHKAQCTAKRGDFICDLCGKPYKSQTALHTHRKVVHLNVVRFRCEVCNKGFFCKNKYQIHITCHSDERNVLCDICGKCFKNTKAATKHKNQLHLNQYTYHCSICGHGVAKKAYLLAHKCGRVHRNQNPESEPDLVGQASEEQPMNNDTEESSLSYILPRPDTPLTGTYEVIQQHVEDSVKIEERSYTPQNQVSTDMTDGEQLVSQLIYTEQRTGHTGT